MPNWRKFSGIISNDISVLFRSYCTFDCSFFLNNASRASLSIDNLADVFSPIFLAILGMLSDLSPTIIFDVNILQDCNQYVFLDHILVNLQLMYNHQLIVSNHYHL